MSVHLHSEYNSEPKPEPDFGRKIIRIRYCNNNRELGQIKTLYRVYFCASFNIYFWRFDFNCGSQETRLAAGQP